MIPGSAPGRAAGASDNLALGKGTHARYLVVQEAIAFSQRVEQFEVSFMDEDGSWKLFAKGLQFGYKRIVP